MSFILHPSVSERTKRPNPCRANGAVGEVSRAHTSGGEGFSLAGSLRRRLSDPGLSPCLLEVIPYMPLKMRMTCCLTVEQNGRFKSSVGNSLEAQWLRLHALHAKGPGSIPGQ